LAFAALAVAVFGAIECPPPLPPMFKIAKFQIRLRRHQPNLTFDFGGYDYWRLWILAGTALAVL